MTQLLEKAIREISELPVSEQDIIATIILDELLDEKQWDTALPNLRTNFQSWRRKSAETSVKAESEKWDSASYELVYNG